ncbi:hypothetical protein OAV07_00765 [Acidimicrobiales bacterium]|nr:hypothetical protein [Acidimicrobiales bacterium]
MKFQFKVQVHQIAAVDAVAECFAGQAEWGGFSDNRRVVMIPPALQIGAVDPLETTMKACMTAKYPVARDSFTKDAQWTS